MHFGGQAITKLTVQWVRQSTCLPKLVCPRDPMTGPAGSFQTVSISRVHVGALPTVGLLEAAHQYSLQDLCGPALPHLRKPSSSCGREAPATRRVLWWREARRADRSTRMKVPLLNKCVLPRLAILERHGYSDSRHGKRAAQQKNFMTKGFYLRALLQLLVQSGCVT